MAKRKAAKRRQCLQACSPGRPPRHAIPLAIPTYWTPEQAIAVFELVDDLRERIWLFYQIDLQDITRQQCQPVPVDPPEIDDDDLPF